MKGGSKVIASFRDRLKLQLFSMSVWCLLILGLKGHCTDTMLVVLLLYLLDNPNIKTSLFCQLYVKKVTLL